METGIKTSGIELRTDGVFVSRRWMEEMGIIVSTNYSSVVRRNGVKATRACRGRAAMVVYSTLPERYKSAIRERLGYDPEVRALEGRGSLVEGYIRSDTEALAYYSGYRWSDGRRLPAKEVERCYALAVVLSAAWRAYEFSVNMRRTRGLKVGDVWESISAEVSALDRGQYPHDAPTGQRLARLVRAFNGKGRGQEGKRDYGMLISKRYGRSNARRVTERIEELLMRIYCMGNKPYARWVWEDYTAFLDGRKEIVDTETGEVYDREDYLNDKGELAYIGESTCYKYLHKPKNRVALMRRRMTEHDYNQREAPHAMRMKPLWGLSKVSLDDRDLPRKMENGQTVKAYYAYDVASGAVIGAAYSRRKDSALFVECVRDMIRTCEREGWGIPLEVEVENHIVSRFKDGLMAAGRVFPYVRWCAAQNSQEKHAEHFNREKKYGVEKREQENIGRWYSKLETNRVSGVAVWNEATQQYEMKERRYSFDKIVADDRAAIAKYNAMIKDKKGSKNPSFPKVSQSSNGSYPSLFGAKELSVMERGLTRWEWLRLNINPECAKIDKVLLSRYAGEMVKTTINRHQWCEVLRDKYILPSTEVLRLLNGYEVEAYWMPEPSQALSKEGMSSGEIDKVYLYQGDRYICTAKRVVRFNTAQAEQVEADKTASEAQFNYIKGFRAKAKAMATALGKVAVQGIEYDDGKSWNVSGDTQEAELCAHEGSGVETTGNVEAPQNPAGEEWSEYLKEWAIDSL